jgi:signal transduction histidine kinase
MGEMISMIAHQWRQPLNAISTSSANLKLLMELDKYDQHKFETSLSQIDDYIQHLSETIDDFRNFFKPDKQKEQTTVGEVIHKSLSIIEKSFIGHEILCNVNIDKDVPLFTYPHELMQVILNILKNAEDILLERDIEEKIITITYKKTDQAHQLIFEDNAGGIPEDIIDKIFDPYFSTKHKKNGTGVGLYMSRVIINEHCQGSIEVENRDTGATFIISLPLE